MRPFILLILVLLTGSLAVGCGKKESGTAVAHPTPVRVAQLQPVDGDAWTASGTVRAQIESPLAFLVPGKIVSRTVSAGDQVVAGQLLMKLDPKDLREQLAAAQAQLNGARSEAENAVAERERAKRLVDKSFISTQSFDRSRTAADTAIERLSAAEAQLRQARNAVDYASLRSPVEGVLLEVMAEPGQVVDTGQAVAVLAQDGAREVEVFIAQERRASVPQQARAVLGDGKTILKAALRELSAAADPVTRTWRARYRLYGEPRPELGSIVRLEFNRSSAAGLAAVNIYRVPVGALSERGKGAQLWVIADGKVSPHPVQVLRLDTEYAYVGTSLPAGTPVVALGTHLLTPGQTVKEAGQ